MFLVQDGNLVFLSPFKQIQEFNFMMDKDNLIVKQKELVTIEIEKEINTVQIDRDVKVITVSKVDEI